MEKAEKVTKNVNFPEIMRWILGVGVVAIISLLYPNNRQFPYDFERGQTWRYPTLYASNDIPILKPEAQLLNDQKTVEDNLSPVYKINPEVARNARAAFLNDFEAQLDSIRAQNTFIGVQQQPEAHRLYGLRVLDKIFNQGIIDGAEELDPSQVITIANGNEFREATIGSLFSVADAQRWLTDSLPYSNLRAPDFMLPLLDDRLKPNLRYSDSLTQHLKGQLLSQVTSYAGLINKGELIISQGSVITDDIFQQLVSYRTQYNKELGGSRTFSMVFLGYALLTTLVVILLFLYLRHFFPIIYSRIGKLIFVLLWPVLYALLIRAVEDNLSLSAYVVPFCIAPIIIKIFFNERLAFFVHVSVVLIASFLTTLGYEFTFLQLLAGIVVIIMDIDTRDWSRYFKSLIYLFLVYALGYLGLGLIKEGSLTDVEWGTFGWLAVNVFFVLLAYPLIPLFERLFGFLSPITLVELSDMNRPLLRELAIKAPGTLQHSLNVANMCEQAARRIGANALLVKTAALYHDIGKTANPSYFIENQNGPNPHEKLDELSSAKIIIAHVTDGIAMAKKAGLPLMLIQFISSHHGDTRTEYFYRNYLKKHPDEQFDEKLFRYPGPRPISKEEAILMLADSTEAACKSLKNPSEQELETLIDNIFSSKLTSGQLNGSKLTFQELETCRITFKNILKSVHHVRIAYPEEEKK